jgi:hypothetical protein
MSMDLARMNRLLARGEGDPVLIRYRELLARARYTVDTSPENRELREFQASYQADPDGVEAAIEAEEKPARGARRAREEA